MNNIFTQHPHSTGETYFQHLRFALGFGFNMLIGGFACILHAIFPFLFKTTASHFLLKMIHRYVDRMPVAEDRLIRLSDVIISKTETRRSADIHC